jgi:hypothetical protein
MIPPVTFGRGSGKFPFMKARIYLLLTVLAAGMVTASAQETKTNAVPAAGEVAAPPAVTVPATSAPAVAKEPKSTAGGALTPASPAPAQPKTSTTPRMSSAENIGSGHKDMGTNPPSPVGPVTEEAKPPADASLTPTGAVPAEAEAAPGPSPNPASPPAEGSGLDRKTALLIGGAILLVAGGLAFFMWRRANMVSHGSLITSAMHVTRYDDKNDDKVEDKTGETSEAGTEVMDKPETEAKPEEKKFPPPMN